MKMVSKKQNMQDYSKLPEITRGIQNVILAREFAEKGISENIPEEENDEENVVENATENTRENATGTVVPLTPEEQVEAEKKRKNFKVFAQYLFQNSKDITPKEAIASQMKKWKDEWVEASIPKKIVKGLELVPEQILYMRFGAAVIGVRTIDYFRRGSAGKKFE